MKKYRWMIAVIALLALINVAKWYGSGQAVEESSAKEAWIPAEFVLHAGIARQELATPMQRDIFQMKLAQGTRATKAKSAAVPVANKKPESDEEEAAINEISQLRLLGVVVRDGRAQAYMAYRASTYLVYDHDLVANRFYVARVAVDSVEILDQKLNIRKSIPITGRN